MPPRQTKQDPEKEVVILQYVEGKPSNLSKFKRWIGPKCVEQFGDLGTLIDTGIVPVVAALPVPQAGAFDDANDPLGIIRAQYMADMKSRQARVDEIQRKTKPMFAYIWMHLSDESKEVLSTQAGWNAIQAAYNIAGMWGLVVQVHQGGGNAQDQINARTVRQAYTGIRQGRHESILDYKRRFSDTVTSFEQVMGHGVQIPAGQQAIDFIMTLDERRFAQFKADMHNCAAAGLAWPGTLQDAYTRASLYK
jgi:hypothetical protein